MDIMDFKENKQESMTRLAVCVVAALLVYSAADKLAEGGKLPIPERYLCWFQENKVQAIAVIGAVIFGLSLALWPVEKKEEEPPDPCCGYEQVM